MSYNLNPTDKLYEAAKELLKEVEVLVYVKQSASKIMKMREALTAYEKSKEEQQSVIPKDSEEAMRAFALIYYQGNPPKSGAWYASWRKCIEWIKLTDEIKQARPAPTQEPESKDGGMDFDDNLEPASHVQSELSTKIAEIEKKFTDRKVRPLDPVWVKNEILKLLKGE